MRTTEQQKELVRVIQQLAKILEKDPLYDWGVLPRTAARQPSRISANLFLLGASVNGVQRADTAWRVARRFVLAIVPFNRRETLWEWIVSTHTEKDWNAKRRTYNLHRFRRWHAGVFRLARGIVDHFDGDPRRIWKNIPRGADQPNCVLERLKMLGVGPSIRRMIVGALRDRKLIAGSSDFKDDIFVRRWMHALGLARSESSAAVLEAGRKWFAGDSWPVDKVFYTLGREGFRTRRQLFQCHARLTEQRGKSRPDDKWRRQASEYRRLVSKVASDLSADLRSEGWGVDRAPVRDADGDVGFFLVREKGKLAPEFRADKATAWVGLCFDAERKWLSVQAEVSFDVKGVLSKSLKFRRALEAAGFRGHYDDDSGMEWHVKAFVDYRLGRNTDRDKSAVHRRLVNGGRMLIGTLRYAPR